MINIILSTPIVGAHGRLIESVIVKMPPLELVDRAPAGVTELAYNMGLCTGLNPTDVDRLSEADQLAIDTAFGTILNQWNLVTALRNSAAMHFAANALLSR